MHRFILFFSVFVSLAIVAKAQSVNYHISIDVDTPLLASVTMEIPEHNRSVLLYSRAAALQTETQVQNVVCNGRSLRVNKAGEWVVPRFCTEISWTVEVATEGDQGIAAYDQKTIMSKTGTWWIFSTTTGLLRLKEETADLTADFDVPFQNALRVGLPKGTQAPGIYALGNVPVETVSADALTLNYISDNPDLTSQFVKPDDHIKALDYLSRVLGVNQRSPKEITMILLGISRQQQSLGGAAGHETMLVNYIFDSNSSSSKEVYYPIIIAIHEQIHQLRRGPHITWVSESLAQFYAAKAILKIYPEIQAVKDIVEELFASDPSKEPGMLEIQSRIDRLGDYSKYDNFYNQGSAFWNELDVLIQTSTDGSESLDDYMPLIMETEFRNGSGFPRRLRRAFSFLPDDSLEILENKYLY